MSGGCRVHRNRARARSSGYARARWQPASCSSRSTLCWYVLSVLLHIIRRFATDAGMRRSSLPREFARHDVVQGRQLVGYGRPDEGGVAAEVLVGEDVTRGGVAGPIDLRLGGDDGGGHATLGGIAEQGIDGFGDHHQAVGERVGERCIAREEGGEAPAIQARDAAGDGRGGLRDILEALAVPGHPRTRTASRSKAARASGRSAPRSPRSTGQPSTCSRRAFSDPRETRLTRAAGAKTTARSIALAGVASPRATEPNTKRARTPRRRSSG